MKKRRVNHVFNWEPVFTSIVNTLLLGIFLCGVIIAFPTVAQDIFKGMLEIVELIKLVDWSPTT